MPVTITYAESCGRSKQNAWASRRMRETWQPWPLISCNKVFESMTIGRTYPVLSNKRSRIWLMTYPKYEDFLYEIAYVNSLGHRNVAILIHLEKCLTLRELILCDLFWSLVEWNICMCISFFVFCHASCIIHKSSHHEVKIFTLAIIRSIKGSLHDHQVLSLSLSLIVGGSSR